MDVVDQALTQADLEMQTAIEAFRKATRMRFFEMFTSADPSRPGDEEAHVTHGISALLRAERHVASASAVAERLAEQHPARRHVAVVGDRMAEVLTGLREHPSPRNLISCLKRARRAIPSSVR